jgi:hypothetical protein
METSGTHSTHDFNRQTTYTRAYRILCPIQYDQRLILEYKNRSNEAQTSLDMFNQEQMSDQRERLSRSVDC